MDPKPPGWPTKIVDSRDGKGAPGYVKASKIKGRKKKKRWAEEEAEYQKRLKPESAPQQKQKKKKKKKKPKIRTETINGKEWKVTTLPTQKPKNKAKITSRSVNKRRMNNLRRRNEARTRY